MMRITRGLENIHSVIDRHEAEWRKEQGEPVEELNPITLEETVRRRLADSNKNSKGRFSADRFLGTSTKTKTPKAKIKEPEPELEPETDENSEENESGVEVVSVIKQEEGKNHSWLYNEVVKAVNNAAEGSKNVKVVAVFVPVVQNGKEFEDLPVNNFVTTEPVNEEDVKVELEELLNAEEQTKQPEQNDFNLLPEGQDEPDAELADAFQTMEEKLDETLQEEQEIEIEEPQEEIIEEVIEEAEEEPDEPQILPHENIETLHLANKVKEPEVIEEIEETQEPVEAVETEEPEETEDNVEEEAEEIEEHVEAESELNQEPEEVTEQAEEAEKVEELPLPPLPDELEDDEIFDETSFSDPLEAIQMLEGDDDEDTSIVSEDGFTFEDAVETLETDDEVK